MLKKIILGIAFLSLAPTTIVAGLADFFAITEKPSRPGPIDIMASWYFMAPQNRLYRRQFISSLPNLSMISILLFAPRKYARGVHSAPAAIAFAFLQNYFRRAFEDGMTKETFVQGLLDTPFSLEFSHSYYPYVILLNTLKYIYLAYEINRLIFDIENECAEKGIESDITEQLVPPNNNYFVLPTESALSAMALHEVIPALKLTNPQEDLLKNRASFAIKYYLSLTRHMIPHTTITMLSADLQNRCYQLSHRISALFRKLLIVDSITGDIFADKINSVGQGIKSGVKNTDFIIGELKLLKNEQLTFIWKTIITRMKRDGITRMRWDRIIESTLQWISIDLNILMEEGAINNLREDGHNAEADVREANLTLLMQHHKEVFKGKAGNIDRRVFGFMKSRWRTNKAQKNLLAVAKAAIAAQTQAQDAGENNQAVIAAVNAAIAAAENPTIPAVA